MIIDVRQSTKGEVVVDYSLVSRNPCSQPVKYPKLRIWSLATCVVTVL